ncbi:Synaptojanin-2-binding protein, partial [Varanus komodoensis]
MPDDWRKANVPIFKKGKKEELGNYSLGFNIVGGIDQQYISDDTGIYVSRIKENGAAALDGRLQEGDKILMVNGKELKNMLHQHVVELFRSAEHIMRMAELDESPVGIKIAGRNNNLRYADDTTLMAESEEKLKSLLMQVKEESAKVGLKLNIKKTKIMASGPLNSWQIDGEEMEVVTDFIFLGSKITTDGDCSQEIQRLLLLGRKAMANLDRILKSRDIILPTKLPPQNGPSSHRGDGEPGAIPLAMILVPGLAIAATLVWAFLRYRQR